MWLLTEITFLYTNTHHSLSMECYLLPSFKTQQSKQCIRVISLRVASESASSTRDIAFELYRRCLLQFRFVTISV